MNLLAVLLSLLMAILAPFSALAATIDYVPGTSGTGGTIQGQVPLTKVGKLRIPDGVATIKDHTIDVVGTLAGTGAKQNVLSGVVLKTDITVSGSHGKATGLAYFRQGSGLTAIDDPNAEELVDVKGGRVITGHIVSINRDQVEITDRNNNTQQVASADISTIHSPKAFVFTMGLLAAAGAAITLATSFTASTTKMSMSPTFVAARVATTTAPKTVAPKAVGPKESSAPSGSQAATPGMSMMTKVILATLAVAGVATAIAVPVAVGCATYQAHLHHSHAVQQQQILANYLYNVQKSRTAAPTPITPTTSSP